MRIDCDSCRMRGRCAAEGEFRARALFDVFGHGRPVTDCCYFQPRFYHGIDGVVDFSPLPSGHGAS
jgi:hypothetical protein